MDLHTTPWNSFAPRAIIRAVSRTGAKPFPNRLREIRTARGWTLDYVAEKLNTTGATISRRESGKMDLSSADIAAYIRLFDVSYGEIYPDMARDSPPIADLTPEINRLCDELAVELLEHLPVDRIGKEERVRVLRSATTKFRAAAAELLVMKRGGKS